MSKNLDEAIISDLLQRDSFEIGELDHRGINRETNSIEDIVSQVEEGDLRTEENRKIRLESLKISGKLRDKTTQNLSTIVKSFTKKGS